MWVCRSVVPAWCERDKCAKRTLSFRETVLVGLGWTSECIPSCGRQVWSVHQNLFAYDRNASYLFNKMINFLLYYKVFLPLMWIVTLGVQTRLSGFVLGHLVCVVLVAPGAKCVASLGDVHLDE